MHGLVWFIYPRDCLKLGKTVLIEFKDYPGVSLQMGLESDCLNNTKWPILQRSSSSTLKYAKMHNLNFTVYGAALISPTHFQYQHVPVQTCADRKHHILNLFLFYIPALEALLLFFCHSTVFKL